MSEVCGSCGGGGMVQKGDESLKLCPQCVSSAEEFLQKRFDSNRSQYEGTFAEDLNNEAAIQMAEVLWSSSVVKKALQILKSSPVS